MTDRLRPLPLRRLAVAMAGAALVAGPASAQLAPRLGPSSDEPIEIYGDRGEGVDDIVTVTGDVRIVQGAAILTATSVVAELGPNESVRRITAKGSVRYSHEDDALTGDEGVYDAEARTITMTGNVVASQGRQVMTGGRLVYWIDTGRVVFTTPGGRIRGIFYPEEKKDGQS